MRTAEWLARKLKRVAVPIAKLKSKLVRPTTETAFKRRFAAEPRLFFLLLTSSDSSKTSRGLHLFLH